MKETFLSPTRTSPMQVFASNLKLPHTTCHGRMSTRPCLLRSLTEHERASLLVSFTAPYWQLAMSRSWYLPAHSGARRRPGHDCRLG